MEWADKPHPVERLVEIAAPVVLAAAAGWAARLAHLPSMMVWGGVALGLAAGAMAMRLAGSSAKENEPSFEPVPIDGSAELDELSLDDPSVELLLDDPLVEAAPDSRVVRLFARPEPTPGELVLRISDYLTEQGKTAEDIAGPSDTQQVDASAALHHALANIRATLR